MRPFRALPVPPRTSRAGFTLVEIVFSLAIVATVFAAMIGLLPAGLSASREAADATLVGTVLEDVQNRLRGEPLTSGAASFSPAFYDEQGTYLATPGGAQRAFFRADVAIGEWSSPPVHTSGLRPITVALSWPVQAGTQVAPAGATHVRLTFAAAPLTGASWPAIDSSYVPKIEF